MSRVIGYALWVALWAIVAYAATSWLAGGIASSIAGS